MKMASTSAIRRLQSAVMGNSDSGGIWHASHFWPVLLLVFCVLAMAAAVTPGWAAVRAPVVLLFLFVVPGLALTRLVESVQGLMAVVMSITLSLAAATLVAAALLFMGNWVPLDILLILVLMTLAATAVRAYRDAQRAADRPTALLASPIDLPRVEIKAVAGWFAPFVIAAALWMTSLDDIDPRAMGDLGLLSVLPASVYVALLITVVTACALVATQKQPAWIFFAYLALLIVIIHATPALAYGTLRYSWAWKHVGLVDFIIRNGHVDPTSARFAAYHNWPGFFILNAFIVQASGLQSAVTIAPWGQVFFQLMNVACLTVIYRLLTRDERAVQLGVLIFILTNWVGQDYYSPQAFAYLLHLVILAASLVWFRHATPPAMDPGRSPALISGLLRRVQQVLDSAWKGEARHSAPMAASIERITFMIMILFSAMVMSHQLTPFMTIATIGVLFVARQVKALDLLVLMGAITVAWISYGATAYMVPVIEDIAESLGRVSGNIRLINLTIASLGQQVVAVVGRALTVLTYLLAAAGAVSRARGNNWQVSALAALVAPILLLAANSYGGEMIFRVYLFSLPASALMITGLIYAAPGTGRRLKQAVASAGLCVLLGASFLFPYYGKERQYYFTPDEIAAANYLFDHAPRGSLIVSASMNYPGLFRNIEYYVHVPIDREPLESQIRIVRDPVTTLARWLGNSKYASAYLIITRSQNAEIEMVGKLPPGATVDEVEAVIAASPQFKVVFANADARVYQLASASEKPERQLGLDREK